MQAHHNLTLERDQEHAAVGTGVPKIPYTFVRGNSDYLYAAPMQVSPGVWEDSSNSPARKSHAPCSFCALQDAGSCLQAQTCICCFLAH